MELSEYITALREDMAATAAAGDEQTRRAAAVLSTAIEPAARLALLNALSDFAAEVTAHLPDHVVEARLDGRDIRVVVTGGERTQPPPNEQQPSPPPPPIDGGDISRMTVRLVEQMKEQAEQAAAAQGVSMNTFISQAVQGALHGKQRDGGGWQNAWQEKTTKNRLHGWVEG